MTDEDVEMIADAICEKYGMRIRNSYVEDWVRDILNTLKSLGYKEIR